MAQDVKGDWQAFYANRCDLPIHLFLTYPYLFRFVDRDAFARFSGIGVGCQQLQATCVHEIIVGPDAPDPIDGRITSQFNNSLFTECYKMDDNNNDVDL